ncbi:SPOR domain-containing protein [Afipia sp. GAS231]|uniref:SPOR domain-containing protein n=1 Tax=Afipia sp. GAS231 TaxID=1882747 RepID=UPI00087D5CEB|nr:SPOR domain-containing protein [Afipia sp. GAS231]SDM91773.1 Sporulation related domain-containing protein [Afipia sp. GAS231]
MANRYPDRPFPAPDHDRGGDARRAESDPLAELARLIGQTDPFGTAGADKAPPPHPLQSRANPRPQPYIPADEDERADPMPPPWMQRARQEAPPPAEDYADEEPEYEPAPVHPLHRYAAQQPAAPAQGYQQDYQEEQHRADEEPQHYADEEQPADPSRYDDALYGQIESGQQEYQRDPAYPDDPYAYQSEYEEPPEPKRRSSGVVTVAAVLALAVVGTGAAFAYRTYVGSPRSGEPPIIKADNSPTKIVPAPADSASGKTPDRMVPGDGGEKLVSREETPVDVNSRSGGPRVVFPPLNQNGSPPPVSSVSPGAPPPATAANGTMPNSEPRKIKTLAVKGDAAENGGAPAPVAAPATKPASAARTATAPAAPPVAHNPSSANASAPLSLAPGGAQPDPGPTRMAATNPAQTAPAPSAGGGYVVQVSSQKSESDAQASFRALQGKYPSVLGSQPVVVKRVDLGEKGVYYRAFAGPFGSADQATQICNNLKAAGGPQCLIQRN